MWPAFINNNLSVVAVDDTTRRVVGVFAGIDEATWLEKLSILQLMKWRKRNSATKYFGTLKDELTLPLEL